MVEPWLWPKRKNWHCPIIIPCKGDALLLLDHWKILFSQASWFALLQNSIRWNDWSYHTSSTDCICSLSWQRTQESRWSLSVLSSYWHRHYWSQYLWKIRQLLFRTRCDVVEMQACVHRRCRGDGRHSKWRCCAHKAIAPEAVGIHFAMHY